MINAIITINSQTNNSCLNKQKIIFVSVFLRYDNFNANIPIVFFHKHGMINNNDTKIKNTNDTNNPYLHPSTCNDSFHLKFGSVQKIEKPIDKIKQETMAISKIFATILLPAGARGYLILLLLFLVCTALNKQFF